MAPRRLTRQEARENTRQRLIDAGALEFARNGFAGTSIEGVVERAGFTRGAFYSNFSSKEDLFLAIMDSRVALATQAFADAFSSHDDPESVLDALRRTDEARPTRHNVDAFVLAVEFWLFAIRHPRAKARLAERYAATRQAFAEVVALLCAKLGIESPSPGEEVAAALLALDTGLALQRFLDPAAVPGDLHLRVVEAFLRSPASLAPRQQATGAE